ncbi:MULTISPECIES: hypothetical protein [Emticicia]|uniref:hypothetical protein n=1 Tax=Emticicia TaxID=312278 RepID=UPI00209D29B6|nr:MULTISPECIES: hypothetical protein [Emticicia]UTA68083.1 hypothetical protein MB380_21185 [Emticicia sp. 21SJ11W-3]
MPAKKEYLSSPGQRALKIATAILGGYFLSITFHLCLGALMPAEGRNVVMLTSTFTLFFIWGVLMILPFLAKNAWKILGLYLLLILLFSVTVFFIR